MPDPATPDASPTRLQLIRIASRLFALYLLCLAANDLTLVPREVLAIAHEAGVGAVWTAFSASYYFRYAVLELSANFFRIALWILGAGWFYRCGPSIQRFFNPEL